MIPVKSVADAGRSHSGGDELLPFAGRHVVPYQDCADIDDTCPGRGIYRFRVDDDGIGDGGVHSELGERIQTVIARMRFSGQSTFRRYGRLSLVLLRYGVGDGRNGNDDYDQRHSTVLSP